MPGLTAVEASRRGRSDATPGIVDDPAQTTARDRPPEEAAEDTSFARGLRILLTIADRGEIRADDLSTLARHPDVDGLPLPADPDGVRLRRPPRRPATGSVRGCVIGSGPNVTSEELIRVSDPVLRILAEETGETAS